MIPVEARENRVEKIAEELHAIWVEWSKELADTECWISRPRLERWKRLWVPYRMLTEEMKEKDRRIARKILHVLLRENP